MKFTNNYNLPQSIFDAISNDQYDGPGSADLSTISVTTLISPPKIRMLRNRHSEDLTEDISENIWRLLGTSVHSVLERATGEDRIIEERLEINVNGKRVSGKTDVYEANEKALQDYKVTSAWSIVYNPEGKKEWEEQLNCLAYLFRQAGFPVSSIRIVAILRDWSKTNAQKDQNYPQIPIVVIQMPLWLETEQLSYIKARIMAHSEVENEADDTIPECTPEERWATETTYAVFAKTNKTATRVLPTMEEATALASTLKDGRVEVRHGEDKRCKDYCSVKNFCHYGRVRYPDEKGQDI